MPRGSRIVSRIRILSYIMNYLLGMGYHESSVNDYPFATTWIINVNRNATPKPKLICVFSTGASPGFERGYIAPCPVINIGCNHNLGHVGHIIHGEKNNQLCGWSASFLGLAMVAYNSGLDFIFQEQDCLAFGDYIGQMYRDLGERGQMVFGAKMGGPPYMPSAQALVLVRHGYIPTMIRNYIEQGPDGLASLPEQKFAGIEEMDWPHVKRLSFGRDRERPLDFSAHIFYAQKLTEDELSELKKRGMI